MDGTANLSRVPAFNVVVVYDTRNAGARALNVVSALLRQFGDEFEFHCDLWRFDVLGLPGIQGAATQSGVTANLIIVSTQRDTDLPSPVKDWLDACADAKAPGSAALVGLVDPHHASVDVPCRMRQFLQSAADRNLLDFFFRGPVVPQARLESMPEALQPRAGTVSSPLHRATGASMNRLYHRRAA